MAHKQIYGQTLSGKSTLAKAMVTDAVSRGIVPVIYDPTLSPDWVSEFVTDDEAVFRDYLHGLTSEGLPVFAVIDEADTMLSMSHRHNWWLFTRARHYGIESCAISQRPQLVAPTIRTNAPEIFIFNLGKNDGAFLADDFSAPPLIEAPSLAQGEFYHVGWRDKKRFCEKKKIF